MNLREICSVVKFAPEGVYVFDIPTGTITKISDDISYSDF